MRDIFKIMAAPSEHEGEKKGLCLGIHIQIGGRNVPCPISKICLSFEDFARELGVVQKGLTNILDEARAFFEAPSQKDQLEFSPEMTVEEVWAVLSQIEQDDVFIRNFNGLNQTRRKRIAEHALTKCNAFSGKASVLSARYNPESGLIEPD